MPDWTRELRRRLAAFDLPPAEESRIVEELSHHLDDRVAELGRAGKSPSEAGRLALDEISDDELRRGGWRALPLPMVARTAAGCAGGAMARGTRARRAATRSGRSAGNAGSPSPRRWRSRSALARRRRSSRRSTPCCSGRCRFPTPIGCSCRPARTWPATSHERPSLRGRGGLASRGGAVCRRRGVAAGSGAISPAPGSRTCADRHRERAVLLAHRRRAGRGPHADPGRSCAGRGLRSS